MTEKYLPQGTATSIKLNQVINRKTPITLAERMSTRMVRCASSLPLMEDYIGWQMYVPVKGSVDMEVFGTSSLLQGDLEWISMETAKNYKSNTGKQLTWKDGLTDLYEIYLPVMEKKKKSSIGFGAVVRECSIDHEEGLQMWPTHYSTQFAELVSAFRTSGACFRAVLGKADYEAQEIIRKELTHAPGIQGTDPREYAGCPIRARFLLRLPDRPSVKLLTVLEEAVPGASLRLIGRMTEEKCQSLWDDPLKDARVYPDYAVRILLMEPEIHEVVVGIEQCDEPVRKIPASHKNTKAKDTVVIGKAQDTSGAYRKITIGDMDFRRHYQIIGQTGTGKSTLLANIILSYIEQSEGKGKGLTFFDPHGSTIDVILRSVPEKYTDRIRVIRIGDVDNPVPLNIWDSANPEKEERNISDLCELFTDIFDPKKEGYVGPRYERWLSTFAKASIAFLGRRASLESIAVISQNQDLMLKLYKRIVDEYPELAEIIKSEYGTDKSSDFTSVLNWFLCKFQRLTSVEQLRKTLGAGANALDFRNSIDTDTVTLIDLASPTIGTNASRIVGTLMLMKLWNAAMTRKNREKTHLIVLDEASLWQTNPLPRMCAEGRKFGIALVLCHQHSGQLTAEIRDALEANSANFSAFRLSPRDAANAAIRFDDNSMVNSLTRLDAFNAITTLSVDGQQTKPFTLEINRPRRQKNAEAIAERIEQRSREILVEPYRSLAALTSSQIKELLSNPELPVPGKFDMVPLSEVKRPAEKKTEQHKKSPYWKESWNNQSNTGRRAG